MIDRSKWQVVLYNEINKKEFCSCCIFNQCLIIQCQTSSGASRWKHNSYRSWTLYGTCYFLMYRLVIVSHNINSALMITRNVLLAWNAIECVFFWFAGPIENSAAHDSWYLYLYDFFFNLDLKAAACDLLS